jgi:hypothetical protein
MRSNPAGLSMMVRLQDIEDVRTMDGVASVQYVPSSSVC